MSQALAAALAKLQSSNGTMPVSAFTLSQRRALDEWARRTGSVRLKTEGAGSVYQVLDTAVLDIHLKTLRPHTDTAIDQDLPRRAANIAHACGRAVICSSNSQRTCTVLNINAKAGVV